MLRVHSLLSSCRKLWKLRVAPNMPRFGLTAASGGPCRILGLVCCVPALPRIGLTASPWRV